MKFRFFLLISLFCWVTAVSGQIKNKPLKIEDQSYSPVKISKDGAVRDPAAVELNNRAAALTLSKDHEQAVEVFREAAKLVPESVTIQANLANALVDTKNYAEAADVCRKIIDAKRASGSVYFILGNALYELKNYSESIASYRRALEYDPKNALLLNSLGLALYKAKDPGALEAFEASIENDPSFADPYNNRAVALIASERYREAVPDLERAVELRPAFAEAHNNMGHAYYFLGKHKLAQKSYLEAVRLRPDWSYSRYNLAMCYLAQGRREEARAQLDSLRAADTEMAARLQKEFNRQYVIDAAEAIDSSEPVKPSPEF
jgi:tetratricopeptide (TPR) repeat protein